MDAPPVQYVRTSDGFSIACAVSGSGPPLIVIPWVFEHVQLAWEYPDLAEWLEKLSERFQIIQLDLRGCGMSTRGLDESHTFEAYVRDVEAVVDELKLDCCLILGFTTGARLAARYALLHPERVRALIMVAPPATAAVRPYR